jgi:hypothetical protein
MTNETPITSVPVPAGTRFHVLSVFAESQDAYDVLTEQDGWIEAVRYDDLTGERTGWKSRDHDGGRTTVHAPRAPRGKP